MVYLDVMIVLEAADFEAKCWFRRTSQEEADEPNPADGTSLLPICA